MMTALVDLGEGFVEVLLALEHGARSFVELKSLDMSPTTVLKRLREAQKMGYVGQRLVAQEGGRSRIKYGLTTKGRRVARVYAPIRGRYSHLREELGQLEHALHEKRSEMKFLLASTKQHKRT
jgi:DNA-binding HxlR family transcriptional regulator